MLSTIKLNNINPSSIKLIYYNIIDLFLDINISKNIDSNKSKIIENLHDLFSNFNNEENFSLQVSNIKDIIKKYAQLKIVNDDETKSKNYKEEDLKITLNKFLENQLRSQKILSKELLFEKFKLIVINNAKNQDPNYIFIENIVMNDVDYKFIDIQDKLYDLLYTADINKFVDIYLCNNTCECTAERLCQLKNEILNILYATLSYKPTNIILLDTNILDNIQVNENEIYDKIYNFLKSKNFDVSYKDNPFLQIFLPS